MTPEPGITGAPIIGRQIVPREQETLGDAALDEFARRIEQHDVEYIADRTLMVPTKCATEDPSSCTGGGALLPLLLVNDCAITGSTRVYQDRPAIIEALRRALPEGERSQLYSAIGASRSKGSEPHVAVAFSRGEAVAATRWSITQGAALFEVSICSREGTNPPDSSAPPINSPYIIPPGGSCVEGDTVTTYQVTQAARNSASQGMFGAVELAEDRTVIDDRAFVWVPEYDNARGTVGRIGPNRRVDGEGALYTDGLTRFADITPGMRLAVTGWRFKNCQLEAWRLAIAP